MIKTSRSTARIVSFSAMLIIGTLSVVLDRQLQFDEWREAIYVPMMIIVTLLCGILTNESLTPANSNPPSNE